MSFVVAHHFAVDVLGAMLFVLGGICVLEWLNAREEKARISLVEWRGQRFVEYTAFMNEVERALKGEILSSAETAGKQIYLNNGAIRFFDPLTNSWKVARLISVVDASRLAQRVLGISSKPGPYRV